jgi:hypothetical protein
VTTIYERNANEDRVGGYTCDGQRRGGMIRMHYDITQYGNALCTNCHEHHVWWRLV